jgi:hypothetical protein
MAQTTVYETKKLFSVIEAENSFAVFEKIFSFAKTIVSLTWTVVFVMQKILSDVETMVWIRRKVSKNSGRSQYPCLRHSTPH